jgi:hypothetical protein
MLSAVPCRARSSRATLGEPIGAAIRVTCRPSVGDHRKCDFVTQPVRIADSIASLVVGHALSAIKRAAYINASARAVRRGAAAYYDYTDESER